MSAAEDIRIHKLLLQVGISVPISWEWDDGELVIHPRPEGVSQEDYEQAARLVQFAANKQYRKPKSLATLLTAINALTNEQKQTLLNAAREAAENSDKTIVQVMGMLTWILTDATMRAKCVAGILRWEPGFARAVNIELDGDEAE